jgi:uncharacterized membrane protein
MKPLLVLNSVFIFVLLFSRLFGTWNYIFAGNAAMAAMLLFTAIGHFVFPRGMVMMLPDFVPYKKSIVFLTGVLEFVAAIGLLVAATRHMTSLFLMFFFIMVLPANINAAIKKVDFQKADHSGKGIDYLWFRIPLQIVFFLWVWYFGIIAE